MSNNERDLTRATSKELKAEVNGSSEEEDDNTKSTLVSDNNDALENVDAALKLVGGFGRH